MGTKPFEFVDLTDKKTQESFSFEEDKMTDSSPSLIRTIGYLQSLIEKHKNGEVFNITVIALLKDERVSIWLPESIQDGELDGLYEPIITALKSAADSSTLN